MLVKMENEENFGPLNFVEAKNGGKIVNFDSCYK